MASSTCSCKGVKRPCVFFHGLGSVNEPTGLQDTSPTDYFGDIADSAPCCTSVKFGVLNTRDHGWTEDAIQQKTCSLALAASPTSNSATGVIKDTIIVGHSMGNLNLAGAIASGKCSLDSSSTWVAASGPFKGSMGPDYLEGACAGSLTGLVSWALDIFGSCPANTALQNLTYDGGSYSSSTLNAKYAAARSVYAKYVDAAMCSNDYSGLLSTDQITYKLAGSVIPHKSSENDGLVEFQSCAAGLDSSAFGSSYSDAFYVTGLNHMDTTFRHGDALFKDSQKPVKWFECLL
jgi:hypothetical protein